jgi:hypothetical protein
MERNLDLETIAAELEHLAEELRTTNLLIFLLAVGQYGNPLYDASAIWDEVSERLRFLPPTA